MLTVYHTRETAPRPPDASTRLVRVVCQSLTAARVLADIGAQGLRPLACGIPQPGGAVALLFWCADPHDLIPLIRLLASYDLRCLFGPLTSLPEYDQPARVLLCGRLLWRWLVKQSMENYGGAA